MTRDPIDAALQREEERAWRAENVWREQTCASCASCYRLTEGVADGGRLMGIGGDNPEAVCVADPDAPLLIVGGPEQGACEEWEEWL